MAESLARLGMEGATSELPEFDNPTVVATHGVNDHSNSHL
jgi:hypothetical protein